VAAILLALTEGQSWGWTGYRIPTLLVSGTLSLALFVVIELEVDEPQINMRIFASRTYNTTLLLVGVAMTAMFRMMYFGPQFLQVVHPAYSPGLRQPGEHRCRRIDGRSTPECW
jgi:hypothetical protein